MIIYIDETHLSDVNDYAFCAVAIEDQFVNEYTDLIEKKRTELLSNPYFDQFYNIKNLKKSFHFTQDHREVKNAFIPLMNCIIFESFIHIYYNRTISDQQETRTKYLQTLNTFLSQRYKKEKISYIWEKDDGLKIKWPESVTIVEKKKKEEPLLAVADYTLGIFRRAYIKDDSQDSIKTIMRDYANIDNKIRFIKDEKIKKPFTSTNPLILS